MTKSYNIVPRKELNVERRSDFRKFEERTYQTTQKRTLANLSLERGDTLLDDANYEIVRVTKTVDKDGSGNFVKVIALAEVVEVSGTPWSELKGTRQVIDQYPHWIEYVITFTGAPASARPDRGDKYSDVTGTSSLSSTNLTREPVAVHVGQIYRVTVNKSHVTIRFRGRYAQSK